MHVVCNCVSWDWSWKQDAILPLLVFRGKADLLDLLEQYPGERKRLQELSVCFLDPDGTSLPEDITTSPLGSRHRFGFICRLNRSASTLG
eukprot:1764919-Amphidinium_carterae.1